MAASVGASKNPPKRTIDIAVIQKLCKEIADKIREEKLYPEDIIKTVEGLKPSKEFVNFVSEVFSKFARKCNQDVFLASMERSIRIGKDFSQPQTTRSLSTCFLLTFLRNWLHTTSRPVQLKHPRYKCLDLLFLLYNEVEPYKIETALFR